jgi:XTP/dITP diphosphohydrolase
LKLLLGTGNPGKIAELRALLAGIPGLCLLTRDEVPFPDVEETGASFAENALIKARAFAAFSGLPVLAEDSGLCVSALGNRPGVRSARYAGLDGDHAANIELLLRRMAGVVDRAAQFVTVAALHLGENGEHLRAGILRGRIALTPRGCGGFGYDPVFVPEGHERTLAELGSEEKNRISHRRRAIEPLRGLLCDSATQGSSPHRAAGSSHGAMP